MVVRCPWGQEDRRSVLISAFCDNSHSTKVKSYWGSYSTFHVYSPIDCSSTTGVNKIACMHVVSRTGNIQLCIAMGLFTSSKLSTCMTLILQTDDVFTVPSQMGSQSFVKCLDATMSDLIILFVWGFHTPTQEWKPFLKKLKNIVKPQKLVQKLRGR